MEFEKRQLTPEAREFELNMQIDAVTRVLGLLGEGCIGTIREAVAALAAAETEAPFFCGFVDLYSSSDAVDALTEAVVTRGYVTMRQGRLVLTDAGRERAATPLPPQIEAVLY